MANKKAKKTQRKTSLNKKSSNKKDVPENTTEDAKAMAEKIFANLKKPN